MQSVVADVGTPVSSASVTVTSTADAVSAMDKIATAYGRRPRVVIWEGRAAWLGAQVPLSISEKMIIGMSSPGWTYPDQYGDVRINLA